LLIDNFLVILPSNNTAYYSLRLLATFLSFPIVNINTSLTAHSNCQNLRTAKIMDPCLIYVKPASSSNKQLVSHRSYFFTFKPPHLNLPNINNWSSSNKDKELLKKCCTLWNLSIINFMCCYYSRHQFGLKNLQSNNPYWNFKCYLPSKNILLFRQLKNKTGFSFQLSIFVSSKQLFTKLITVLVFIRFLF